MKFNIVELFRSAFVKRDQKFRQRLTVFFICLLISVFVWFTVKMDNEYQEIVPIPLTFVSSPRSMVLVGASDSVLYVELSEKGSELLRYRYLNSREPLEVNTRNVILTQRRGESSGYILTSSLIDDIGYQHDLAGRVVSISPDTLYLSFKRETYKKVPVTASLQISTQKQYMVYGNIRYEPDSVLLRGPEDVLEGITSVTLGVLDDKNLKETTEKDLPVSLSRQFDFITARPDQVHVTIPIEEFTESNIEVPVSIIADSTTRIRLFPDAGSLSFLVALKDFAQVTPGMFKVVADFSNMDLEKESKVRLRVAEAPSTIKITRIEPEKAEFIIIK